MILKNSNELLINNNYFNFYTLIYNLELFFNKYEYIINSNTIISQEFDVY